MPLESDDRLREWTRVLHRWRAPDASRRRELTAVALNLVPLLAGLVGLAFLVPHTDWGQPVLLASLAAVSAVAYAAEARLRAANRVFFGANLIVALVALAALGPVAAFVVWLVPDLLTRYVLHTERRLSPGFAANVASFALAALAGAGLLALAGSPTGTAIAPALYAAGVAMWAVNFCFARLTFAPYYQRYRPAAMVRDEFAHLAPAVLGMLVVGVLTAVLVSSIGVLALAPLALVIVVPQAALERMAAAHSTADLSRSQAIGLYSAAIADVLGLSRGERRELSAAAELVAPAEPGAAPDLADAPEATVLALHAHERWAGDGWPAGLPAEAIPLGSRILAVAEAWSEMTARGTLELPQSEAILALAAQSGSAFDPQVVDAAARVVGDEEGFAREPTFQPTLHRLRVPRGLRRTALPAVLPRLVDPALD
jgi:hypothetical protein